MSADEPTLVDKIVRRSKNNPVVAVTIVAFLVVGAAATFWKNLPDAWTSAVVEQFHLNKVDDGWIFLGYQDHNTRVYWSEGPYADIIGNSEIDPMNPYPIGSRIRINHRREIIVVDYKKKRSAMAYAPPPSVHGILASADRTGSILEPGTELIVRDVWIGGFPGRDLAVWARVVPAGTAD